MGAGTISNLGGSLPGVFAEAASDDPLIELGDVGLKRFSGTITEEFLAQARGARGQRLIIEMRDNHPIVGAVMFALRMLLRQAKWHVESASDKPDDVDAADFVSSCLDDMSSSWQETMTELLSFLEFGWSFNEIIYKLRQSPEEGDGSKRSRYTDKRIGWRKISLRAQETLLRWELDPQGGLAGMWQMPPNGGVRFMPIERALLFRAGHIKGNPEGRSVLRNAMVPYLMQRKLQEIEAIGAERDLAGLPVITAPAKIMRPDATPQEVSVYNSLKSIVQNLRRDTAEGIVMPSDSDKNGKPLYELKLLSSGGSRQFDCDKIIQRYDQRITMVVLADFIMLGHGRVGTNALSQNKTNIFQVAIGAWLDSIAEVFNRYAIPRLLRINSMSLASTPNLAHSDVEAPDLAALATYIQSLAAAGMPLFPDPALEEHLRDLAGLPEPSAAGARVVGEGKGDQADEITPVGGTKPAPTQGPVAALPPGGGAPPGPPTRGPQPTAPGAPAPARRAPPKPRGRFPAPQAPAGAPAA